MSCSRPSRPWTRRPCSRGCSSWWRPSCSTSGGCRRRRRTLQACPDPGRGLSVVAEEHPAAVPSAHCPGVGGAVSRDCRDPARTAGPSLHRGGPAPSRPCPTGSGRASTPASARPIWKPSATSPRGSSCSRPCQRRLSVPSTSLTLQIALGAALQMAKGLGSARGGARLHPGTRVVSAGGRDARACPGPVWAVAVLYCTVTVAHGARARGNIAAPGATCPRPRARCHRPLCPRGDVVLPGRVARCPPAPGARHRPLHARPAPCSGVPHGPRSGCWLPSLCRLDPLVAGVPGASPGPHPRGPGVGARAVASL